MKNITLFFLTVLTLLPAFSGSAFAAEEEWVQLSCNYPVNRIPDGDSGTDCRTLVRCMAKGKRYAFAHYLSNGSLENLCCTGENRSCVRAF